MSLILSILREIVPWAMSFSFVRWAIYGLLAMAFCFGGYYYLSSQGTKSEVQVLRRENSTLVRSKAAIERRIQTDGKVSPLPDDAKMKELRKWSHSSQN